MNRTPACPEGPNLHSPRMPIATFPKNLFRPDFLLRTDITHLHLNPIIPMFFTSASLHFTVSQRCPALTQHSQSSPFAISSTSLFVFCLISMSFGLPNYFLLKTLSFDCLCPEYFDC